MSDWTRDWRRERRTVPERVMAEAAAHPGGTVSEIDESLVADPSGYVPREAIIGVFVVGPDGVATGDYLRNPDHGPVQDDFERLTSRDHWLGWLPGSPSAVVRTRIEDLLEGQVAGARVEWLKIVDDPVFLTGLVRHSVDSTEALGRRAGLALPFVLSVASPARRSEIIAGAFTWVAAHLDHPERRLDRTWLDIGASRAEASEELNVRIYELDDEV